MEEMQRWREALTNVANLSGWHIGDKPQYVEVEEIVQKIVTILGHNFSILPMGNLVGMDSRVGELAKLLCLGSSIDVRVVGICGMGGIGKTTLAHALYERIFHEYDFHCFIDDVSKTFRDSGISGVQKQLVSQSLHQTNLEICNLFHGTHLVLARLRNARALIIFDNVDQVEQLQMFTGNRNSLLRECLGRGSRIIIISRDKHIIDTYGVDDVYQVPQLNHKDAVKLFCRNAFKANHIISDYEDLTYNVLSHAQGHPLAIQVLGSSLFGRNVSQWRSALAKLQEHKSENIMDVLRISFDQLDAINREIYLDIACFFNECNGVQFVKEILDFRGFHSECGLQDLIDKSLITITPGWICMHQLLQDLGKCIVREKSPKEPNNWSRLWKYKDLHKILSNNMEAKKLEVIAVKYESDDEKVRESTTSVDALSKMSYLKLLKLKKVNFSGSLDHLSTELGYIDWDEYPFQCLPPSFQPSKLVELCMSGSNIKYLWKDKKPLHNLRRLVLSNSKCLIKLPDFREAQNLELLNLEGCIKLKQLHPSIGLLRKLTFVNLKDCISLVELPHFSEALNIEILNVGGCIQLKHISPSIGLLIKLRVLNLKDCESLVSLPNNILCLTSLEYLSLYGCSKLYNSQMLEEATNAEHLKKLCIDEASTDFKSMSSKAKRWFMRPSRLSYTRAHKDLVGSMLPSSFTLPCLHELDLSYCNLVQIPNDIGNLHFLKILSLMGNNFATLPNLKGLLRLYFLNLNHCKQLEYLPELPLPTEVSPPHLGIWSLGSFKILLSWGSRELSFNNVDTGSVPGLHIFNCPTLVKREGLTNMCLSWMKQLIKGHLRGSTWKYSFWHPIISSVIPGSEIPRWFNTQHVGMGRYITIKKMGLDNRSRGLACCVVFITHSEGKTNLEMVPPKKHGIFYYFTFPVDVREDIVRDKSYHMWLFYWSPQKFEDHLDLDSTFIISIKDKKGFHFEVKKYGYRWVYENDL